VELVVARIDTLIDQVEAQGGGTLAYCLPSARRATLAPVTANVSETDRLTPGSHATAPSKSALQSDAPTLRTIDSTQTVRALTALELEGLEFSKWFSIQLVESSEAINADEVPDLDIFDEYRLYCVRASDEEPNLHILRVGFFSSEVAAQAVASYLAAYFPAPKLKRISVAERERFAEGLVAARKDVGASGRRTDVEVVSPRSLPEPRVHAEALTPKECAAPKAHSFWSRLVGARVQSA
jgi:hypothetical protein